MESRSREKLFLLEHDENQIIGAKLPSKRQVLRVLFYNLRIVKLNLRSSAHLVVKEVEVLWEKARIPVQLNSRCVEKLELLYQKWKALQKGCKRRSQLQDQREKEFLDQLDDLFDIAHADALEMITIEEDKQFLLNQRKKGRPGSMIGGDRSLYEKEQRQELRQERKELRRVRVRANMQESEGTINFTSDDDEENQQFNEENPVLEYNACDYDVMEPGPSEPKRKRGSKQVITLKLVATLDKCKVSDRDAVRIIAATAQALGHDINDLILNRTSIRHYRTRLRAEHSERLRAGFPHHEIDAVTVHWDGKMLPALVGKEKVERLPVIVNCRGREQLLGIPAITSSTGRDQALAVHDLLREWDLCDKIQALSCDTTASNMGRLQGACAILEHEIGRDLLYLPCRHHIYEIVLRSVFDKKMSKSTGPNIPIFKRFQQAWPNVNKLNFHSGVEDAQVIQKIKNVPELINFAKQSLQIQHPREDYREFIELVLLFLGNTFSEYNFRAPGAFHHARWMAKGIYCLKIFLFREEFELSEEEKNGIRDICIFIANLYLKAWIEAPLPTKAPQQDLTFIKSLYKYKEIDKDISHVTLEKFCRHLWYLTPENAALSFFDNDVSIETKNRMIHALSNSSSGDSDKKFFILPSNVIVHMQQDIARFISDESLKLFSRFNIPTEFLKKDPIVWKDDHSYKLGLDIVKALPVVNDSAERAVKLMQDYNNILARNEEEKQLVLEMVKDYRQQYPDAKKSTLEKNM